MIHVLAPDFDDAVYRYEYNVTAQKHLAKAYRNVLREVLKARKDAGITTVRLLPLGAGAVVAPFLELIPCFTFEAL